MVVAAWQLGRGALCVSVLSLLFWSVLAAQTGSRDAGGPSRCAGGAGKCFCVNGECRTSRSFGYVVFIVALVLPAPCGAWFVTRTLSPAVRAREGGVRVGFAPRRLHGFWRGGSGGAGGLEGGSVRRGGGGHCA